MAGSFLTLSAFNAFFFNMVNGRGWVCVALVVFASWRPGKALFGALLFAFFDALQLRLQQAGSGVLGLELPYQVYLMLPVRDGHRGAGGDGPPRAGAASPDEALPAGGRALACRVRRRLSCSWPGLRQRWPGTRSAGRAASGPARRAFPPAGRWRLPAP
ncbi:MAG: hypothetical protein V9G29_00020 [Burkholderiaceae bacterium]